MPQPTLPLPAPAAGFIGQHPDGAPAWTLTTRLGHFLTEAERLFGPRDQSWTVLGVEFSGDTSCIWFPGNTRHLAVRLTLNAAQDPRRALFQLAHETVHLLAPVRLGQATVLEEGLATWFADLQAVQLSLGMVSGIPRYLAAKTLVDGLLAVRPAVIELIRREQPIISQITSTQLLEAAPGLDRAVAEALCRPF